jgi:hypothetical protein
MIRVRTTSFKPAPAFSRAVWMISKHLFVCPAASPGAAVLPSAPMGAVPPTETKRPTRTALENPTTGSYGLPLDTSCRFIFSPLKNVLRSWFRSRQKFANERLLRPLKRIAIGLALILHIFQEFIDIWSPFTGGPA